MECRQAPYRTIWDSEGWGERDAVASDVNALRNRAGCDGSRRGESRKAFKYGGTADWAYSLSVQNVSFARIFWFITRTSCFMTVTTCKARSNWVPKCDDCTSERTNVVCLSANEWHNKATVAVHECRLSPPRAMLLKKWKYYFEWWEKYRRDRKEGAI